MAVSESLIVWSGVIVLFVGLCVLAATSHEMIGLAWFFVGALVVNWISRIPNRRR